MGRVDRKTKLADTIIDEIKRMLKNGELKKGDKLPNQTEFAKQLGVSRISLREALNVLHMIGVIEQKPRVGTIIVSGDPDLWMNHMDPPLISDSKKTTELIEARNIIELAMAEIAFHKITSASIEIMKEQLEIMNLAFKTEDKAKYQSSDLIFHKTLAMACSNQYLISMFDFVYKMMDEFMKEFFDIIPDSVNHSLKMHKAILQGLTENDEQKFLQSIRIHLETIKHCLVNYYEN